MGPTWNEAISVTSCYQVLEKGVEVERKPICAILTSPGKALQMLSEMLLLSIKDEKRRSSIQTFSPEGNLLEIFPPQQAEDVLPSDDGPSRTYIWVFAPNMEGADGLEVFQDTILRPVACWLQLEVCPWPLDDEVYLNSWRFLPAPNQDPG